MGYYGGEIVPGKCEDFPCCGHHDGPMGETFCPQPPPSAEELAEREEQKQIDRQAEQDRIAGLAADCDEYFERTNALPDTWRVYARAGGPHDAEARRAAVINFSAEYEEHESATYPALLILVHKQHRREDRPPRHRGDHRVPFAQGWSDAVGQHASQPHAGRPEAQRRAGLELNDADPERTSGTASGRPRRRVSASLPGWPFHDPAMELHGPLLARGTRPRWA
jgi:hypothetical protein